MQQPCETSSACEVNADGGDAGSLRTQHPLTNTVIPVTQLLETGAATSSTAGLSVAHLDCLAAVAFAVGSPLQRGADLTTQGMDRLRTVAATTVGRSCDVNVADVLAASGTHPSLLIAYELLRRGVDPDRVVALIQSR